jgi:hypothetical protein
MKTKIRSVRPLSVAKIHGVLYGVLGLLIAPFFLIGPGLAMVGSSTSHRAAGFGAIILFAAIVPFCYAIIGFLMGGLMAFLYNAVASAVGGLEIELDPSFLPTSAPASVPTLPAPTGSIVPTPPATSDARFPVID